MLVIKRKLGVCFYYVLSGEHEISLDKNAIEITRFKVRDILEKIKEL